LTIRVKCVNRRDGQYGATDANPVPSVVVSNRIVTRTSTAGTTLDKYLRRGPSGISGVSAVPVESFDTLIGAFTLPSSVYRFAVCARRVDPTGARSHPPIHAPARPSPRAPRRSPRSRGQLPLAGWLAEIGREKPIHNAATRRIKARLVSRLSESPLSSSSHPLRARAVKFGVARWREPGVARRSHPSGTPSPASVALDGGAEGERGSSPSFPEGR